MNTSDDDVTQWIPKLRGGDAEAAQRIWEEYFQKLVNLARRKLQGMPRRHADEEDVACSALDSFFARAKRGRFPQLSDRHDLSKVLFTITIRKAMAEQKKHRAAKRGGGNVRGDSIFANRADADQRHGFGQVAGDEPTPEMAASFAETVETMLARLGDPQLREIAILKMEGYSNEEVAARYDCTTRTVERKLGRIRSIWSSEADAEEDSP